MTLRIVWCGQKMHQSLRNSKEDAVSASLPVGNGESL